MFKGKQSYGEFLNSDEKISTNILADRLKRLEEHEIVEKIIAPDNRSKLLYSLTAKGKDLLPVMLEVTAWSARHDKSTNTPKAFLKTLRNSREQMMADILRQLD